jgi:serine/threonine protein phosphatase 1
VALVNPLQRLRQSGALRSRILRSARVADIAPLTPDVAVPESPASNGILRQFPVNESGRDFVVGDIHGMFSHLRALLEQIGFDEATDRLFSVGDLVDRGPESNLAVQWLGYPWFHAVRGNHEQFALDSDDPEQLEVWLKFNGGEWWVLLSEAEQAHCLEIFRGLPIVIEVETAAGKIGIVHADVPPLLTWEKFITLLQEEDREATFYAIWSRNRIQGNFADTPVRGDVDRVYCGHTPIRNVLGFGNVHFIDTGAVYCSEGYEDARLTLIEIQPATYQEYAINTNDRID